ncbi:hypothetical protein [Marmoricola sp. RAF53]|uniref:hypothetical protein n=1 Tax=Marmoricola sp. RAF53 TaxID=3233059 RepID=UPI003F997542
MPRWAIVAAVVLALVPAAWFTAHRVFGDSPSSPSTPGTSGSPTESPIPAVSPSAGTTPTTTPPPTPTPTPTPTVGPAADLTRISEDVPRRLTSGSALDTGFDDSVEPAGGAFSARSASEVSRWGSRGQPGSPGSDTVFVIGEVRPGGAFGALPDLRPGAKVALRTDNGTLTYTVRSVGSHAAAGITTDPAVVGKAPGTLVLLGIRYDASGDRTGDYVVVKADLSDADNT